MNFTCNTSQMLIGRGLDNGCSIVQDNIYHYNLFGIIIDWHYPTLESTITAVIIIGLIILVKKSKILEGEK